MKNAFARLLAVINKPRVLHYVDIFAAAFAGALLFNKQHILDAHGLNATKSLIEACAVTGGKAVLEAYRKNFTPPSPPAAK